MRRLLPGVLLVVSISFGLLAMHTLGLHGTSSATVSTFTLPAAHPAAHQPVPGPGPAIVDDASGPAAEGHRGGHGVGTHSCPDCTDDHLGMAMGCVLALALALLILLPPRPSSARGRGWARAGSDLRAQGSCLPRAPSLHDLCISRT